MTAARKLKATLPGPVAAEALFVSQVPAIRGTLARLRWHLGGYLTALGFLASEAGCGNAAAFQCGSAPGVERQ